MPNPAQETQHTKRVADHSDRLGAVGGHGGFDGSKDISGSTCGISRTQC
jgi:hypothetical protein